MSKNEETDLKQSKSVKVDVIITNNYQLTLKEK